MCPDIADPFNGQITFSDDRTAPFELNTTATYSCEDGYMLNGSDPVRTCMGHSSSDVGVWSGSDVICGKKTDIYYKQLCNRD